MTTTEPSSGADVDAWEAVVAGWEERVRCQFVRRATGQQCRRAAVWVGSEHEHGPTTTCTQHYHRWANWATGKLAKNGYFVCTCGRKFQSLEEAVIVRRL
jgi:hypothetical protein